MNYMLVNFVKTLKQIEDGSMDQYDASVKVGTILKEMYVDSALKTAANLESDTPKEHVYVEPKAVSWKQYKCGGLPSPHTPPC